MLDKYIPGEAQQRMLPHICELETKLTDLYLEYWKKHVLFEPQWWLLLALFVIPWVIWWRLVDKRHFFRIAFFGWLAVLIAAQSDMIGNLLGLWSYQYQLLPLQPKLVPIDFAVFPVVYMLIYQYFQNWRSYVIASLVIALVFAFIGEPLLVHLGIYKMQNWRHWYSFPIYFIILLFLKWLVDSIARKVSY